MAVQRGIAPIFKAPPRIEIILFPQRCWHCQIRQKMLYKIDVALFQKSPFPSPGCQKMPTWLQSSVPGGNHLVFAKILIQSESPETALQNSCGTFLNKILFDPQATIILPVTSSTSSFKHYVPVSQQFPPTKLSEPAGEIIFPHLRLIVLKKSSN